MAKMLRAPQPLARAQRGNRFPPAEAIPPGAVRPQVVAALPEAVARLCDVVEGVLSTITLFRMAKATVHRALVSFRVEQVTVLATAS
ncbi:hypothetical protein SD70_02260 [Gordoniibacillus kamchatkensis]|uniref:Transposase n=2 Tax=Gordoniibacillus kamchatkensis TaxID=1590651 RepID=A0ABR5ANE4_9BACL|nr:hypothetical protein SD70_02260 [Paenibacillus sp. VKM B-2647]